MKTEPKLFERLKRKLGLDPQHRQQVAELRALLANAMADRHISDAEYQRIDKFHDEMMLTQEDFIKVLSDTFSAVVQDVLRDRRVTNEEWQGLMQIAKRLNFAQETIDDLSRQTAYFGLLHAIEVNRFEDLPAASNSGINLQKGEIDYFTAHGSLMEERVVRTHTVGRSSGVSVRLMKGVTYRTGGSRGRIESERQVVPVSGGLLTITNKRIVFSGDNRSINAPLEKVLIVELFNDGIRFGQTNKQKPSLIKFADSRNAEIFGLYVSRILNQ